MDSLDITFTLVRGPGQLPLSANYFSDLLEIETTLPEIGFALLEIETVLPEIETVLLRSRTYELENK